MKIRNNTIYVYIYICITCIYICSPSSSIPPSLPPLLFLLPSSSSSSPPNHPLSSYPPYISSIYLYLYVCIYVCMYVCMYVCIHIYIYVHQNIVPSLSSIYPSPPFFLYPLPRSTPLPDAGSPRQGAGRAGR